MFIPAAMRYRIQSLLALVILLAGCNAAFAPPYDQSLVDGVTKANQEALVLFSEVSAGADASRYATLAPKYDALIGKFEALRIQADARGAPALGRKIAKALSQGNPELAKICGDDAALCVNASPSSLQTIVENFERMKTSTRTKGLTSGAVGIHKGAYELSIQQVLVVETALKG